MGPDGKMYACLMWGGDIESERTTFKNGEGGERQRSKMCGKKHTRNTVPMIAACCRGAVGLVCVNNVSISTDTFM